MITRNVTLWFGSAPRVTIPVSQYDDMWQFVFSIVNDSVPWSIPDSAQVTLNGLKPDGNVFAYYGTVSGGKATVDCDIQMTAVAGLVECELSILDSGKVVGTANFFLSVEQAPKADDAVVSESTLSAYGEVLDEISQYAAGFIPEAVKTTLLNCFAHVAWIDEHGQDYYDALADALAQKTVLSISAVFTQGANTVWSDDSLDVLKQYLVVTATYDDTTTADVTAYVTLSGTLTAGTSTITVTYDEKTTTFAATVTGVGSTNYADSLANILRSATPTASYADGVITMKTSQTSANNYSMWCFDRAKTLWSAVVGKKLRIRVTKYSTDWVGDYSNVNPQNRVIDGLAIFQNSTVTSGSGRQRWVTLGDPVPTSSPYVYEYIFDADVANFTGGTGTPTSSSTFGYSCYDASPNTIKITNLEIVEVLT